MDGYIDLHIHTNKSDGIFEPEKIVKLAIENGLSAISITDHDTLDGYYEACNEAGRLGIELIPGIELSCEEENKDIHILGYFIDGKNAQLEQYLYDVRHHRRMRVYKVAEKLKNMNIDIMPDSILDEIGEASPGRLHIARKMYSLGIVNSVYEAFDRYIGENCPGYVKKMKLSVIECVKLIHNIGGIAVLAHPATYKKDHLIPSFIKNGVDGIEVYHPEHKYGDIRKYLKIAKENGLLITGGSDFHGLVDDHRPFGAIKAHYSLLDDMKNRVSIQNVRQ